MVCEDFYAEVIVEVLEATTECYTDIADESAGVRAVTVTSRPVLDIDPTAVIAARVDPAFDPAMCAREALRGALRARPRIEDGLSALMKGGGPCPEKARVAISGMPAAHFTIASSVAAASLAVRGRRTVCAYLLEGLQPHRGGLSQATTECYTDIADESAGVRAVTVTSRPVLDIDPTAVIAAPVDPALDPAMPILLAIACGASWPTAASGKGATCCAEYFNMAARNHSLFSIFRQHYMRLLDFETFGGFGDGVRRILRQAADQLSNKLSHAQHLDEVTWTTKNWHGLQMQRLSVVLHTAVAWQTVNELACGDSGIVHGAKCIAVLNGVA
ncbi:hypothetical protein EMIHUDRAFT_452454 [Emiliania huxleyi CCMP1516]|uniref:Uncharacterized protein n=2 Tax=Emiliania huxleyi TaxID=2903 RepID=A0A0D3IJE5_EMIH1|nr:hypothetical protein EMIHUDRAFT_452454 [Emiliania huxleyi CCMP1516]EOD11380.1 hypothetical protein EMIHUDRAFT_452454 [Emiliania huxleyi CCMP1516]|eukprot:XP_005763809.1 hypothetical protein EMIHUDRAFT_452454 [Emiliania huxleyi CCMP1516]